MGSGVRMAINSAHMCAFRQHMIDSQLPFRKHTGPHWCIQYEIYGYFKYSLSLYKCFFKKGHISPEYYPEYYPNKSTKEDFRVHQGNRQHLSISPTSPSEGDQIAVVLSERCMSLVAQTESPGEKCKVGGKIISFVFMFPLSITILPSLAEQCKKNKI